MGTLDGKEAMMVKARTQRTILAGAMAAGLLFAAPVWAAESSAQATANTGKAFYLKYCAACHGKDGKGAGAMSSVMSSKPMV